MNLHKTWTVTRGKYLKMAFVQVHDGARLAGQDGWPYS